jgi:hypothetical protein
MMGGLLTDLCSLPTFAIVAQMDLREQFVTQYPVNLVAGATYYKDNLFIARTASLGGQTLAQIVDVRVSSGSNYHSLYEVPLLCVQPLGHWLSPHMKWVLTSACGHVRHGDV